LLFRFFEVRLHLKLAFDSFAVRRFVAAAWSIAIVALLVR
jgi:hypothetical protein